MIYHARHPAKIFSSIATDVVPFELITGEMCSVAVAVRPKIARMLFSVSVNGTARVLTTNAQD